MGWSVRKKTHAKQGRPHPRDKALPYPPLNKPRTCDEELSNGMEAQHRGARTHTWATTWERKVSMARSTPRKNALNISARFSIISFTLTTNGSQGKE